jgi:hypothetical protein
LIQNLRDSTAFLEHASSNFLYYFNFAINNIKCACLNHILIANYTTNYNYNRNYALQHFNFPNFPIHKINHNSHIITRYEILISLVSQ